MSNANKMREIAGIFGLEIGEKFNIVCNGKYADYSPYVFTEEGLVDKDGDILSIQADGTLRIFPYVNPALGLKLDDDGRIIIDND